MLCEVYKVVYMGCIHTWIQPANGMFIECFWYLCLLYQVLFLMYYFVIYNYYKWTQIPLGNELK